MTNTAAFTAAERRTRILTGIHIPLITAGEKETGKKQDHGSEAVCGIKQNPVVDLNTKAVYAVSAVMSWTLQKYDNENTLFKRYDKRTIFLQPHRKSRLY